MQKYSSLTLEEHQQHCMKLYQDDDAMQIKITNIIKKHSKARMQIYSKTAQIPLWLNYIPGNETQVDWETNGRRNNYINNVHFFLQIWCPFTKIIKTFKIKWSKIGFRNNKIKK